MPQPIADLVVWDACGQQQGRMSVSEVVGAETPDASVLAGPRHQLRGGIRVDRLTALGREEIVRGFRPQGSGSELLGGLTPSVALEHLKRARVQAERELVCD